MPQLRAVIFDMDGVLVDSEPLHLRALNGVLAGDGCQLSEAENEELLGTTLEMSWQILMKRFGLREPIETYIARYHDAVIALLQEELEPLPGVVPLLDALHEARRPVALASSSLRPWIDATLRSLRLTHYFPIISSGDEVTRGKPDPEIFLLTANRLGQPPEACLVIEDSPNGILAAKRAGMTVIGVRTPYTAHLTLDADLVVNSLVDLDLKAVGLSG